MNNNFTIITEGEFDARVIKRLLKDRFSNNQVKVISASGYSSALSKVKSLLSSTMDKLILVLDTESLNEPDIKQKEEFVNSYINVNLNKPSFKTFWAIPEFEIIFLSSRKFLDALGHDKFTVDIIEIGKLSPKRTLERISHKNRDQFIPLLDKKEVRDEILRESFLKELVEYLQT